MKLQLELPPVGATVVEGRRRYRVERHGCATLLPESHCPNGPWAITVARLERSGNVWATTECLHGLSVSIEDPKAG
jgi:hypothetical protein